MPIKYVMLCYVMLCYVMLCYVMLCYVMLCKSKCSCLIIDFPITRYIHVSYFPGSLELHFSEIRFSLHSCVVQRFGNHADYSWFSRDVTKILKSKPGGLQKFYLNLRKGYLKIYSCTIP